MSHSYGEARPIGRMVPHTHQQPPPAPAACARCACNLSRYRDHWQHHCLTCQQILVDEGALRIPTFEPTASSAENARRDATNPRCRDCDKPLARNSRITAGTLCRICLNENKRLERARRHQCTDCGVTISSRAKRCEKCASPVRYIAGTKESCYCKCGSRKKNGAMMCYTCRYRRAA